MILTGTRLGAVFVTTALFIPLTAAGQTVGPEPLDSDRPHVGTGTHTVPPGQVQFELGGQLLSSALERAYGSPALIRVGVTDGFEARLAFDGLVGRTGGELTTSGIGNVQIGGKFRLFGAGSDPILSLLPTVNFGVASERKGLGSGETDATVTLLAGHSLGERVHTEANYGIGTIGDPRARFVQHLVTGEIGVDVGRNLVSYVELASWSRLTRDGGVFSFVDFGVLYSLSPRIVVDGGALVGASKEAPDYGFFTGLSFVVGRATERSERAASTPRARPSSRADSTRTSPTRCPLPCRGM